jgi:hypothetical protein
MVFQFNIFHSYILIFIKELESIINRILSDFEGEGATHLYQLKVDFNTFVVLNQPFEVAVVVFHDGKFADEIFNCVNAVHRQVFSNFVCPLMLAASVQYNGKISENLVDVCKLCFFICFFQVSDQFLDKKGESIRGLHTSCAVLKIL